MIELGTFLSLMEKRVMENRSFDRNSRTMQKITTEPAPERKGASESPRDEQAERQPRRSA
jgi:hypothetical protein